MSLRKSPTRTPALLAANRANAQKCTGPRTPEAKTRVALNALRHGLKAQSFFSHLAKSRRAREEFNGLYRALYAALLPDETGIDLLKRTVLTGLGDKAGGQAMGRFACRAGGVVCPDGRGVSRSMAIAHPAPKVEGASLGLGALGKGPGRPPLVADGS
jgi:hypothetical protein